MHINSDLSTPNMKYLTSQQALADLAQVRQFIVSKYNLTSDNKWISFGGSYSGALSAWLRLKYPHLIHAAIASSAPVLALVDFTGYLVVVNNSLTNYNEQCSPAIQAATNQVQDLIKTQSGRNTLQQLFK